MRCCVGWDGTEWGSELQDRAGQNRTGPGDVTGQCMSGQGRAGGRVGQGRAG